MSPPVGCHRLQPPSPFIIITQLESWYSFTIPRRVEGWVDLGTAGRVHTAHAQGCKSQWLCDKHNCPQRDSIPGPRALQSGMLPLDQCILLNEHDIFTAVSELMIMWCTVCCSNGDNCNNYWCYNYFEIIIINQLWHHVCPMVCEGPYPCKAITRIDWKTASTWVLFTLQFTLNSVNVVERCVCFCVCH